MSDSDLQAEIEQLRARAAAYERREQDAVEREAGLRRELALFQLVIDSLPMRVFWKEAKDLRYLGCGAGFAHDVGYTSSADFIGRDDYEFSPAPLAEAYRADDRRVIESRQARVNFEEPQNRPDGGEAWLLTSKIPLVDADGALVGVLGTYEDITERRVAERARLSEQERLITAQQDTLRELSTPLIPLADNVVAMPLVGTIDARRANQIMETLLEGIATFQADIALLDVSGVRVIDTQVADALLRTARAAKLLGAQVLITGISAEIAQTVVHLGADMSGIITVATLREGLQYAASQI
jgi:rsbT co-antagonist protein RsbR